MLRASGADAFVHVVDVIRSGRIEATLPSIGGLIRPGAGAVDFEHGHRNSSHRSYDFGLAMLADVSVAGECR
jgi:hypothetical protein